MKRIITTLGLLGLGALAACGGSPYADMCKAACDCGDGSKCIIITATESSTTTFTTDNQSACEQGFEALAALAGSSEEPSQACNDALGSAQCGDSNEGRGVILPAACE